MKVPIIYQLKFWQGLIAQPCGLIVLFIKLRYFTVYINIEL